MRSSTTTRRVSTVTWSSASRARAVPASSRARSMAALTVLAATGDPIPVAPDTLDHRRAPARNLGRKLARPVVEVAPLALVRRPAAGRHPARHIRGRCRREEARRRRGTVQRRSHRRRYRSMSGRVRYRGPGGTVLCRHLGQSPREGRIGLWRPFSQPLTVANETPSWRARPSWVSPLLARIFLTRPAISGGCSVPMSSRGVTVGTFYSTCAGRSSTTYHVDRLGACERDIHDKPRTADAAALRLLVAAGRRTRSRSSSRPAARAGATRRPWLGAPKELRYSALILPRKWRSRPSA